MSDRAAFIALIVLPLIGSACADAHVSAVESVGVTVADMDRSIAFYENVLTFEKVAERTVSGADYDRLYGLKNVRLRIVRLRLGQEFLELMQFQSPAAGRQMPADSRGNDRWFQHIAIIVSDMDTAYARLRSFHVEHASSYPQKLPDYILGAGGIRAFYFRDPDEHFLEILAFPAEKGAAKWHQGGGTLFMGIDHTAIVVADSQESLRFYRDTLGMKVAGTSENFGYEQEHLNNVFGAHLLITGLRAPQGPGVEFLEYLAPRGGRPMPADTRPNDIWFWQINFSSVESPALLRDPDGHASAMTRAP